MTTRRPLEDYLALPYPARIDPDPDVGHVVSFPDLPGCSTHAASLAEIGVVAEEARTLWIRGEYEDGHDIPLPTYPEEYSGKFVARLPRSLHRQLAEEADRQGVSLNQHVVALLARGDAQARLEHRLIEAEQRLSVRLDLISAQVERLRFQMTHVSFGDPGHSGRSVGRSRSEQWATAS